MNRPTHWSELMPWTAWRLRHLHRRARQSSDTGFLGGFSQRFNALKEGGSQWVTVCCLGSGQQAARRACLVGLDPCLGMCTQGGEGGGI